MQSNAKINASAYSTMELLPGPSLKNWSQERDFRRLPGVILFLHVGTFQENLRQRYKFCFLYSAGLRHLYSRGMLHGDPHLRNVVVLYDMLGNTDHLVTRFIPSRQRLLSIRMLDPGTSLFRDEPGKIRVRESKVIRETAERLFPDFIPNHVMGLDISLDPTATLSLWIVSLIKPTSDLTAAAPQIMKPKTWELPLPSSAFLLGRMLTYNASALLPTDELDLQIIYTSLGINWEQPRVGTGKMVHCTVIKLKI